jgi:hypothetical protein
LSCSAIDDDDDDDSIYRSMVYLTTFSASEYGPIAHTEKLIEINELEEVRKEAVMDQFKVHYRRLSGGT